MTWQVCSNPECPCCQRAAEYLEDIDIEIAKRIDDCRRCGARAPLNVRGYCCQDCENGFVKGKGAGA